MLMRDMVALDVVIVGVEGREGGLVEKGVYAVEGVGR